MRNWEFRVAGVAMRWITQKMKAVAIVELVSELNCRNDCATRKARHGSQKKSSSFLLQEVKISCFCLDQWRSDSSKSYFRACSFTLFVLDSHRAHHLRVIERVEVTSTFQVINEMSALENWKLMVHISSLVRLWSSHSDHHGRSLDHNRVVS